MLYKQGYTTKEPKHTPDEYDAMTPMTRQYGELGEDSSMLSASSGCNRASFNGSVPFTYAATISNFEQSDVSAEN